MKAMKIDWLVGDGQTRIVAMTDYNAATDVTYAFHQAHLSCAREDKVLATAYEMQFQETPGIVTVEVFDTWEDYRKFAWGADQHCCSACGGHLSNPARLRNPVVIGSADGNRDMKLRWLPIPPMSSYKP